MKNKTVQKRLRRIGRCISTIVGYAVLAIAIAIALFPAIWMFMSSIKSPSEIFSLPPTFISQTPSLSNYERVIFETNIPRSFLNSVFISSVTTACVIIISVFAAYAFARFVFKGSKVLSTGMLFGQMIPAVVLLIPLFKIYAQLNMINTYRVNILTNVALNLPMAVLTMTSFFKAVPKELDEAAMIDGCGRIRAIFKILIPISTPGLVTVGIFTFLNTWEEFLFAFNFANGTAYKTLAVAIKDFKGQFIIDWGGMMSAAMVIALPVLLVFLLCNKYFIKGITSGSVKG